MISQHYDEAALVALLDSPGAESDVHLVECADCRRSFEEYQAVTSCLGEQAVWDLRVLKEDPVPQTIQNIRAFADRMRDEDAAALPLVAELLAGPRDQWMPRLQSDPKYRTAGVVRKLMEASDKAIDVMPPHALEISALATEIADHLDPAAYPSDTVMKLRGNAWRDRGFCLYQNSRFGEAMAATTTALAMLQTSAASDYDQARAGVLRSLVERSFDNFAGAAHAARNSASTFSRFGDMNRVVSAAIAECQSLWKSGRTGEALERLLRILSETPVSDRDTHSRLLANIAFLYRESGDASKALAYYEFSRFVAEPQAPQNATETIIQWNIAVMIGRTGNYGEAERRMLPLMKRFEDLGMTSEAIQAGLELSEFYLADGRYGAAELLCRKSIDFYSQIGTTSSQRALTALGLLQEAVAAQRVTASTLRDVRRQLVDSAAAKFIFLTIPDSP